MIQAPIKAENIPIIMFAVTASKKPLEKSMCRTEGWIVARTLIVLREKAVFTIIAKKMRRKLKNQTENIATKIQNVNQIIAAIIAVALRERSVVFRITIVA